MDTGKKMEMEMFHVELFVWNKKRSLSESGLFALSSKTASEIALKSGSLGKDVFKLFRISVSYLWVKQETHDVIFNKSTKWSRPENDGWRQPWCKGELKSAETQLVGHSSLVESHEVTGWSS